MSHELAVGLISRTSSRSLGTFRGRAVVGLGVTRKQLAALVTAGVIERLLPNTYRMTAVARSHEQCLRAALLWAGPAAAAAGRSASEIYGFEGVRADRPEIVVPRSTRLRHEDVIVRQSDDRAALMVRAHRGIRVTGAEATLLALGAMLDPEAFEIAFENARRQGHTSVSSLRAYLARHGGPGRTGVTPVRRVLDELDPQHPARSTLEVKTRRLLVTHGLTDFRREFPLDWHGRSYRFDFAFERQRTILETNGRRWHDDPIDYEHDNEKWSVPGRHGYRLVFATWDKVTRAPGSLISELATTLAA
jgi:very-short-patch-repair endonuclease